MFWGLGCFEDGTFWKYDFLVLGHFEDWDVLRLGMF
jgi:hypothetical protein